MNINTSWQCLKYLFKLFVVLYIILALTIQPCLAQGNTINTKPDLENIEQIKLFFDKIYAEKMLQQHIPGAAFTLVKNDKVLSSKGYGFANWLSR